MCYDSSAVVDLKCYMKPVLLLMHVLKPFCIAQVKQQYPNLVMVDYTLPDVIHDMANLYIKHRTPFVMGVSGIAVNGLHAC
jgi:4-hydroxy-tetrahydrodipicolinate reductase